MTKAVLASACLCATATLALGQTKGVDYYSASAMGKISRELAAQAAKSPKGIAPRSLETYPNHFTMITTRTKTGGAEMHQHYADIFVVVGGTATLVTGGKLKSPKTVSEGETRGSAVIGGNELTLRKGDIVHISPDVPHQLLVPSGKPFTYFVVKVKE